MEKLCKKCEKTKDASEFHKCNTNRDGLQSYCKECRQKNWLTSTGVRARADKGLLFDQGLKRCSKCMRIKPLSSFHKSSSSQIGVKPSCKECAHKQYRMTHKKPKQQVMVDSKKSRQKYLQGPSKSKQLFKTIPKTDKPAIDRKGYIQVACYFCKNHFKPTVSAILTRKNCFNGAIPGEGNFYCSENCKKTCPTFKFQPDRQTDPRSKLYVPPTETQKARAAQTDKLKKAQCLEVGYNYCERCGDIIDVELHHTLPVSEYGMESIDHDSHMLLCPGCHVTLHREVC